MHENENGVLDSGPSSILANVETIFKVMAAASLMYLLVFERK